MHLRFPVIQRSFSCKIYVILLAFCWIVSFIVGTFCGTIIRSEPSIIEQQLLSTPTFVGFGLSFALPAAILLFCFKYAFRFPVYIIFILRAFCFGASLLFILTHYRSGGWLISSFVFIPETVFWVYFLYHAYLHFTNSESGQMVSLLIFLFLFITLQCLQATVILPSLSSAL